MIIDNGSAHRGKRSIDRLTGTWPNIIPVHTPIHVVFAKTDTTALKSAAA